MIVQPKVRGFICTTAHPTGCAAHVEEWIQYVKQYPLAKKSGPKKVLVIGASTGFGLASRIVAAVGYQAETIGVFFERPADDNKRTASAGWYNTAAFESKLQSLGVYAKSINGDAFSDDIKKQTIALIKKDWGGHVDLVIYSIASPRRTHPKTGEVFNSVLKPIGQAYRNKTVDVMNGVVSDISIEPATESEIQHTEAVMGGDDWLLWMQALLDANCLSGRARTVAFTYIGPEITHAIYRNGTIGRAKTHLEKTAKSIDHLLKKIHGHAWVSVNKALVTQASAAIPVVPLYISLLYKIMKEKNIHEGCIQQMYRLFHERLYGDGDVSVDADGRIRVDDWEMRQDVQTEIQKVWASVNTDNLTQVADLAGYRDEFYRLFGFGLPGVNYQADVNIAVAIPSVLPTESV